MERLNQAITGLVVTAGGIILCLMMVQIVVDVFMRNVVGAGFPATAELVAKYYMVAVSFIPVAYAELKRRHIEATIFTDFLPKHWMPSVFFIGFTLSAAVYATLTWGTYAEALKKTAKKSYVEAGSMDFYTWPSYWILPVAFGVMTLICVLRILSVLFGQFTEDTFDPVETLGPHPDEEV